MKNLAGVDTCDQDIKEELYLAGIETGKAETKGEVPFSIEGRIGYWKLRRAWRYWVAIVENDADGLPLEAALELHNTPNPIDIKADIGYVVRAGGDGNGPCPSGYVAQPVYDDELNEKLVSLGYKKQHYKLIDKDLVDISYGEVAELCNSGKLDVQRYVNTYHIDTQIGLNVFAAFIKDYYFKNVKP